MTTGFVRGYRYDRQFIQVFVHTNQVAAIGGLAPAARATRRAAFPTAFRTTDDFLKCMAEVSGRAVPTEYVGRRAGDPAAVGADNRKATAALEWVPQHGLRDIIEAAWRWHESRPNGYA